METTCSGSCARWITATRRLASLEAFETWLADPWLAVSEGRCQLKTSKNEIPENIYSSDTINIFEEKDYAFTRETRPISLFWSFEKSMYQTISEEMLKVMSSINEFAYYENA